MAAQAVFVEVVIDLVNVAALPQVHQPVDAVGRATGAAQQITDEPSDAPTWSGDSKRLLYLSNGELRLVDRDGSHRRAVPVDLSWSQEVPSGRTLIHAGRLWDGRGPQVETDVDIVVVK